MKKIKQFQITSLMLSGFKSYEEPTELVFGNPTVITGGNGRGKSSIADAIAFAVTGCPFFGERGIDRLHNENNPDVAIRMCFVDETGTLHELNRARRKNRMTITYDGYEIRQLDLADLFGERDVFLSILNPLYFIEELGEDGKKLLERYLPTIPHETVLSQLSEPVREHLKNETILSPEGSLKRCREEIRSLEERITYLRGQKDLAASQGESHEQAEQELTLQADTLREEIAELEQRQFSGMDVSDMQERLVELSGRYRSMPETERGRRLLTDLLRSLGHDLHGIPGFRTYYSDWTLSGPSGFLIPVRNKDGLIQGLKIRLDDAQQANRKYRWLSSRNLPSGTRSYSWVHVTGKTQSKRAFLTEGPLKGDVASFLAQDALFICIGGVNALHGLTDTIRELGVREVVEAMDMDQMTNPNVRKAVLTMRKEVQKIPGIRYAKYTWNPAYKGVDDYLLSQAATM